MTQGFAEQIPCKAEQGNKKREQGISIARTRSIKQEEGKALASTAQPIPPPARRELIPALLKRA
jgi:hypothetical protein